jgi:2,3-bisphosphoglycerate-independent phosphoglycerate mutase
MSDWKLKPHPTLAAPEGPVLVVVLDGVGEGPHDEYDAVHTAQTPTLDELRTRAGRYRQLRAHGRAVGLPSDGDMGNSEVGHNALGCGRVVMQGASLVDAALEDGSIFESPGFAHLEERFTAGGTLHLIGLLSDGGVHSRFDQLAALLDGAAERGAKKVRLHVLTDGRDVPDGTAGRFAKDLEDKLAELREAGVDARIASGGGRMVVTMDRYEADWSIVERGWRAHVLGDGRGFSSMHAALETMRSENAELTDQTFPPFVITDEFGAPVGPVEDGDAVCCFNFRGDRVIEISRAFEEKGFKAFDRVRVPHVHYAGMMEYDGDLHVPKHFLVPPPAIDRTSGEWLAKNAVRTFACSETQKFGHVTYFWNGNRSGTFDDELERYVEIESDRISFDKAPAMKAEEIVRETCAALRSGEHDLLRINIANGDMVGHTGNLEATVSAMETVDRVLKELLDVVDEVGGRYLVTADHGNADDMAMRDKSGAPKTKEGGVVARTSHTLSPVPAFIGGAGLPEGARFRDDLPDAGLANVTATFVNLLGFAAPDEWEPGLVEVPS